MMFGTSTGKKKEITRKQDEKTGELIQRLERPGTTQTSSVQYTQPELNRTQYPV